MTAKTTVRARDIMRKEVITLMADASVAEAVETFEEYKIGGAPVIDAAGQVVGVLTSSDLARKEHVVEDRFAVERSKYYLANPLDEELYGEELEQVDAFSPEVVGPATVKDWMTDSIISVPSAISVHEICRVMVEKSIHRVLVVDAGKLVGIVSTFDIVRHLACDD